MNFFEQQRIRLDLNPTQMAARLGITSVTVRSWEMDTNIPRLPIARLATDYEVTEKVMEREVMALRRRVEAKRAPVAAK